MTRYQEAVQRKARALAAAIKRHRQRQEALSSLYVDEDDRTKRIEAEIARREQAAYVMPSRAVLEQAMRPPVTVK